jgi:crotonobetainyl-CoA:carnitine CoA-transferase CaiB-like acyl-CoA transferase
MSIDTSGSRLREPSAGESAAGALPLGGITVLSLEHAVAAPFATRQLADLGARVIKLERPGTGDFARGYDTTVRGLASYFVWLNRSKESIALDLKSERGREVLRRLVDTADVVVQNLAPGAADRLGIGAEEVRTKSPEKIHCSISGFGEGGPYALKKAYDLLIQCESGLVMSTGSEAEPAKAGISVADIAAGMYAYSGILAALLRRAQTGQGATVEISMLEALGEWMGNPMYYTLYGSTPPRRTGTSHASIAPYGSFPCAGGAQVFFGIQNHREWTRFCAEVLEDAGLASDQRFATNSRRVENRPALNVLIAQAFSALTAKQVVQRLEAADIANAHLRDMHQFIDHPQLTARGRWTVIDSEVGKLKALLPPGCPTDVQPVMGPVPELGEHTESILAELSIEIGS